MKKKSKKSGLKVVMVKIRKLIPNGSNPRRMDEHNFVKLCDSIEKYGFRVPVICNRRKGRMNRIVGGHQRVRAATTLEMDEVPVSYVDLSEKRERELALRLGRNTGKWDWDMLAEADVESLLEAGFTEPELAANGAGGMGVEVESAEGGRAMTLRLAFATEREYEAAASAFVGSTQEERTESLISAVGRGELNKALKI